MKHDRLRAWDELAACAIQLTQITTDSGARMDEQAYVYALGVASLRALPSCCCVLEGTRARYSAARSRLLSLSLLVNCKALGRIGTGFVTAAQCRVVVNDLGLCSPPDPPHIAQPSLFRAPAKLAPVAAGSLT